MAVSLRPCPEGERCAVAPAYLQHVRDGTRDLRVWTRCHHASYYFDGHALSPGMLASADHPSKTERLRAKSEGQIRVRQLTRSLQSAINGHYCVHGPISLLLR